MNKTLEELVEKWKPLLDWTSKICPPVPEEKQVFVAQKLEYFENEYRRYPKFLKSFIPQVRYFLGDVSVAYSMIYGTIGVLTQGLDENDEPTTIAIPLIPECDLTGPYSMKGYYVFNNGNWKWI